MRGSDEERIRNHIFKDFVAFSIAEQWFGFVSRRNEPDHGLGGLNLMNHENLHTQSASRGEVELLPCGPFGYSGPS